MGKQTQKTQRKLNNKPLAPHHLDNGTSAASRYA